MAYCEVFPGSYNVIKLPVSFSFFLIGIVDEIDMEFIPSKDAVYDAYVNNGRFPGDVVHFPKHRWNLAIALFWNTVIFFPTVYALKYIVASFSYAKFAGIVTVLFLGKCGSCYLLSQRGIF